MQILHTPLLSNFIKGKVDGKIHFVHLFKSLIKLKFKFDRYSSKNFKNNKNEYTFMNIVQGGGAKKNRGKYTQIFKLVER